jgi:thymidylate synthase (FAD)
LHFLFLRDDQHAQYEIQAYAEIILNKIVKRWVPHTYSAFKEFQLESYNLSKTAIEIIKKKLQGQKITFEKSGLSKREWIELKTKFNFK